MEEVPRKLKPHIGVVTFRIDIRSINPDNTLSEHILQNADLDKYKLAEKGQFIINGVTEADCAKKIAKIMEIINEK
tara:strand:- start:725 stop:952 length:228 start_codon:yes stop_codon:yes gene_type:complete